MSKKKPTKSSKNTNLERRDLIKGLATVPVAGVFLVNLWRKMKRDATKKANLLSDLVQLILLDNLNYLSCYQVKTYNQLFQSPKNCN